MEKNLANSNLPEGGQNQSGHENVNPIIILILAALIIFLIIGQFFLPITTVNQGGRKKQISLNDFALDNCIDLNGFTTDKMFFLTEEITMKDFLKSNNTTLVKYFSDNGISENDLMSNVLDYKSEDSEINRLFSYEDIITNAFKTDVPLSEYMIANEIDTITLQPEVITASGAGNMTVEQFLKEYDFSLDEFLDIAGINSEDIADNKTDVLLSEFLTAHKNREITLPPEVITMSKAENTTVEQFLKDHDFNFVGFLADAGINSEDFAANVLNYKSDNDINLLVESYQSVIISIFNTNLPMSEYILANHLSKEVLIKTGEDATEEDLASGQLTKTILTAKLTPEQLRVLTNNYFKSGFNSIDGLITFIFIASIICCIASIVLIIIAFYKSKSNAKNSYRYIFLSFASMLVAKLLLFFADIIVKGEFTGGGGKYTSWTRFVTNNDVHIWAVPMYVSTVLVISLLISLVITIVMHIKNKLRKNNA